MYKVYNHENFYTKLDSDLRKARFLVLIQSPFMTLRRINELSSILSNCVARGVIVCVFAQAPDKRYSRGKDFEEKFDSMEQASRRLISIGVHLNLVPSIHEKLILVDEKIFWEGSLAH